MNFSISVFAIISAATDPVVKPVSNTNNLPVFLTDLNIAFQSNGFIVLRSITSTFILKLSSSTLRSAGLSRQKISYLKNIAKSFKNKSFNIRDLKNMNDEQAISYITQLKGLGIWSAQMFLMFNLNRPDIFPTGDIGFLRAISKNYKVSYPPSKRLLDKISKIHIGYRSVFTWYMWRSIDSGEVEY